MLTAKQERFVQGLVKGMSQREAYKDAYPGSEKWKPVSVDNKASKLFNRAEVKTRYEELMSAAAEQTGDDAVSMRAFIIETYKKIASGEICEESIEEDAEGNITKKRKTVRPNDVNNAIAKLAEYYGVTPDTSSNNDINVYLHSEERFDV